MNQILCHTAAALTAAALYEIFPGCELLGGGLTPTGFFYQVIPSIQPVPETLKMLEERMRQMVRERRECKSIEMVVASAIGLFTKLGHMAAVEALREFHEKELVSLVQIGSFYDLAEGPFCSSLQKLGAFALVSLECVGEREYRVEGCVAPSKEELKAQLKRRVKYAEENATVLGQELGLWERSGVWRQRGLRLKRTLIAHFTKDFLGEEVAVPEGAPWPSELEAFWSVRDGLIEQIIYCASRDLPRIANSLLQTAEQSLRMLGFHPVLREEGWTVEDGLGHSHRVVKVQRTSTTVNMAIEVETILRALLEQSAGNLPRWLAPEYVRILPLDRNHEAFAKELAASLEAAGVRTGLHFSAKSLKDKLASAKRERVPFVVVVGDRELEARKGTLRRSEVERGELLDVREMIERLNEN